MNKFSIISLLLFCAFLSSCAFNSRFLHPEKVSISIEQLNYYNSGTDTTYFLLDSVNRHITLLDENRQVRNQNYTIENTFFMSSNGNRLNAWVMNPKQGKPSSTILHFHGNSSNLLWQYTTMVPLVEKGYQVITVDYSGFGFSTGKASRKNALEDAYAALDFAKTIASSTTGKLLLYGHSYGGYLAGIVGPNRQESIDGIVIEGAFSAHRAEAKTFSPSWGNLVKNGLKVEEELKKNQLPLLVIHSKEDKIVPIEFGRRIYESAVSQKAFFEIDNIHCLGLQYYAVEIMDRMESLFEH